MDEYEHDDVQPGEHPVFGSDPGSRRGSRRAKKNRSLGWLAALLALLLLIGGGTLLVVAGVGKVKDLFGGPEDYSGSGTGEITIEVHEGDTAAAIGRTLKAAGVVKSVDAFVAEASADERSRGIQVGFYLMAKKMSARSALDVLVDPDNLIRAQVTVPEGLTVDQIVALLAKRTDFAEKQLRNVLARPAQLGLPAYAEGNPEGYLFPATYEIKPNTTALSLVKGMVSRFNAAADEVSLEQRAADVDMSPHDVVTVASIIEREVKREQDLSGVAEVIDNRLSGNCPDTAGLLQMDSTVHYAAGANDSVFTTDEMRDSDSPYNTYKFAGLPPGPISAPGQAALEAALSPTDEGYCYFVAVNLETGETLFAQTGSEHAANVAKLDEYCNESDLC